MALAAVTAQQQSSQLEEEPLKPGALLASRVDAVAAVLHDGSSTMAAQVARGSIPASEGEGNPGVVPVPRQESPWDLLGVEAERPLSELFRSMSLTYGEHLTGVVRDRYFADRDSTQTASREDVLLVLAGVALLVEVRDLELGDITTGIKPFRPVEQLRAVADEISRIPRFQKDGPMLDAILDAPNWFTPPDEGDAESDRRKQEIRGPEFLARVLGYQGRAYCTDFYASQSPRIAAQCEGVLFPLQLAGSDTPQWYVVQHSIMRRGFHAQICVPVENPMLPVVVSFKGTQFLSGDGSGARDVPLRPGYDVWELTDSTLPEDFTETLAGFTDRSVILCGHSLGGADAQYAAARMVNAQLEGRVRLRELKMYAFNAPGVSRECAERFVADSGRLCTPLLGKRKCSVTVNHVKHEGDLVQTGGVYLLGKGVPLEHAQVSIFKVMTPITAVSTSVMFRHTALHTRLGRNCVIEVAGEGELLPDARLSCLGAGLGHAMTLFFRAAASRLSTLPGLSSLAPAARVSSPAAAASGPDAAARAAITLADIRGNTPLYQQLQVEIRTATDRALIEMYLQLPLGESRKLFLALLYLQWGEQNTRIVRLYEMVKTECLQIEFLDFVYNSYCIFTDPEFLEQDPRLTGIFNELVRQHGELIKDEDAPPLDGSYIFVERRQLNTPREFFANFIPPDFQRAIEMYRALFAAPDPFMEAL